LTSPIDFIAIRNETLSRHQLGTQFTGSDDAPFMQLLSAVGFDTLMEASYCTIISVPPSTKTKREVRECEQRHIDSVGKWRGDRKAFLLNSTPAATTDMKRLQQKQKKKSSDKRSRDRQKKRQEEFV
jgi:hypothetical protein